MNALKPTGKVDTRILANACLTGDASRDIELAKNLLTAMHKIDGQHVADLLDGFIRVGFFKKYGPLVVDIEPRYANPANAVGVEIVSR